MSVRAVVGFALGYISTFAPGLLSIYNPHQYETDPLFQPVALSNLVIAATGASIVVWLFARRWSDRTLGAILAIGLALTVVAVAAIVVAATQPMRQAGSALAVAQVGGTFAIPCVAVLTVVFGRKSHKEAAA